MTHIKGYPKSDRFEIRPLSSKSSSHWKVMFLRNIVTINNQLLKFYFLMCNEYDHPFKVYIINNDVQYLLND